jgi:stage II sporulation protein D
MLDKHPSDSGQVQCPTRRVTLAALAALMLCAPVLAPSMAQGRQASAGGASQLVIDGAGYGHGVGMSQEGALGYAEHGWSYVGILSHYYTGTAIGQVPADTFVKVLIHGKVKRVALEAYVRGVIAAEVPSDWPMAALEAQAVASRTYAITAHTGGTKFDVYADTRSQVYRGKTAETTRTNAAVDATAGQVVTYDGLPAITYFFAVSGGHTESVQNAFPGAPPQPWLVGVLDPYDNGPLHRWTVTIGFSSAASRLKGLVKGAFRGIEVVKRGSSPRIVSAYVLGSKGRTPVGGPELAQRLGLYDTWAYFSVKDPSGLHPEPDVSGPTTATATAMSQPSPVNGSGGSGAAQTSTPVAQPAAVSGSGGSPAMPESPARAQPASVNGQGGVSAE